MSPTILPKFQNIKVLIAEDNQSNFDLLKVTLRNYTVEWAHNGLEAIQKAHTNKYSIIFMDLMMPEIDGFEATRQIRIFDPTTPIVAITANIYTCDENDALQAGCTAYFSKPIRKPAILEIMEEMAKPIDTHP